MGPPALPPPPTLELATNPGHREAEGSHHNFRFPQNQPSRPVAPFWDTSSIHGMFGLYSLAASLGFLDSLNLNHVLDRKEPSALTLLFKFKEKSIDLHGAVFPNGVFL